METHLEKIEGLERWQAWAEAGKFIVVQHGDDARGALVKLSREDVKRELESATQIVFASATGGGGAPTSYVRAFAVGQGPQGGAATEFVVQRPVEAGQWLQELVAVGQGSVARFYEVGPWVVEVRPRDLYAYVVASTDAGLAASYRSSGETYQAMFRGSSECADRTGVVLGFLKGVSSPGVPGEMARLAVAMFVSEAARNHRMWGVNLMLLDLLRGNAVPGGWGALVQEGMHPMAKGGTFEPGKVGMQGGRVSRESWAHATGITMLWLTRFGGMRAGMVAEGEESERWRDPVKGEAYGRVVWRQMRDGLVRRFGKVGVGWD